jgi:hypothetical protein
MFVGAARRPSSVNQMLQHKNVVTSAVTIPETCLPRRPTPHTLIPVEIAAHAEPTELQILPNTSPAVPW